MIQKDEASVSVIIPCYNCKSTIERAVKSVFDQTIRPKEVILINDASSDDTLECLLKLRDTYGPSWLKVISLEANGGPSVARNTGWEAASELYIAFLDADDSWHPRKLEIQYNWMILHPEVDVTSHLYTWVKGDAPDYNLPTNWQTTRISRTKLLLKNYISTSTVMLKRDTPHRFNPQKRYSEDYLLWLTILLQGYTIWHLEIPLAYFYKAPYGQGGLSRNLNEMEIGELENYMFLQKQGMLGEWEVRVLRIWSQLKYLKRLFLTNLLKGYK